MFHPWHPQTVYIMKYTTLSDLWFVPGECDTCNNNKLSICWKWHFFKEWVKTDLIIKWQGTITQYLSLIHIYHYNVSYVLSRNPTSHFGILNSSLFCCVPEYGFKHHTGAWNIINRLHLIDVISVTHAHTLSVFCFKFVIGWYRFYYVYCMH